MFTEEDKQKMDNAAADAQNDLMEMELDEGTMRRLGNWWKTWVGSAGHKRLGRVLLEFADRKEKGK